jgi:probable rRNA maturation factor
MIKIWVQRATRQFSAPAAKELRRWALQTLRDKDIQAAEITIRIVNSAEMSSLNSTYRHKQGPTNVLSFPYDIPQELADMELMGDIIICAEVVKNEAKAQGKKAEAHWAHMVVHGVMHLLGHDHVEDADAEIMETLEIKTLKKLGFNNPYTVIKGKKHE